VGCVSPAPLVATPVGVEELLLLVPPLLLLLLLLEPHAAAKSTTNATPTVASVLRVNLPIDRPPKIPIS